MKVSLIPAVFAGFATAASLPATDASGLEFSLSSGNNVISWSTASRRGAESSEKGTYNLPDVPVTLFSGPDDGTSAYREKYAPKVEAVLKKVTGLGLEHGDAKGTLDSIQKCAAQTEGVCLFVGQGNLLADAQEVKDGKICIVRTDLDPEYGYVFWRQGGNLSNNIFYNFDQLQGYDDVRAAWIDGSVTLVTSKASTGSVKTLENLEADIEKRLGGADVKIKIVEDWDAVKQEVKNNENAVGFSFRNGGGDSFLLGLQDDWGFAVAGFAETVLAENKTFVDGSPVFIFNERAPYAEAGYIFNSDKTTPALGSPVTLAMTCPDRIQGNAAKGAAYTILDLLPNVKRDEFSLAPK